VLSRKAHIGGDIGLCVIHQGAELRHARVQFIGDVAPMLASRDCIVLGERGSHSGGNDAPLGLAGLMARSTVFESISRRPSSRSATRPGQCRKA
jgi:hypothetical protein